MTPRPLTRRELKMLADEAKRLRKRDQQPPIDWLNVIVYLGAIVYIAAFWWLVIGWVT